MLQLFNHWKQAHLFFLLSSAEPLECWEDLLVNDDFNTGDFTFHPVFRLQIHPDLPARLALEYRIWDKTERSSVCVLSLETAVENSKV